MREAGGGSRFLYESFDVAAARIEANERVAQERWAALEFRLSQIDAALERLDKRIWVGEKPEFRSSTRKGEGTPLPRVRRIFRGEKSAS